MFKISEAKKKEGKQCCAYACKNAPVAKKGGLCHKHYARKLRERDPVYARFNQFKSNATRRGKPVEIDLEFFRKFCDDTGYIVIPGMRGRNATIDRIKNSEGYKPGNIQLMTHRQNIQKFHNQDKLEDCPF